MKKFNDFDLEISQENNEITGPGFHYGTFVLIYSRKSMQVKHAFFHEIKK